MDGYVEFFIMTFIGALASTLVFPILAFFMFKDQSDLLWIKKTNGNGQKRFSKRSHVAFIIVVCVLIAAIMTLLMNYSDWADIVFIIIRVMALCTVPVVAVLLYIKNHNKLMMAFNGDINEFNMMTVGRFSMIVLGAFLPVLLTYIYFDSDDMIPEDIPIAILLLDLCIVPIVSTLVYRRNLGKAFYKELGEAERTSVTTPASFCAIVSMTWLIVLLVWGILMFAFMIGVIMSV